MRQVKLTIKYFNNTKKVSISTDDISSKNYDSGELLINYINVDFDKLLNEIQSLEEDFISIILANETDIENSIDRINKLLDKLVDIHPFNSDYSNIFNEYIGDFKEYTTNEFMNILKLYIHELGQQIYYDKMVAKGYYKVIRKCYYEKNLKKGLSPFYIFSKTQISFLEINSKNINKSYYAPLNNVSLKDTEGKFEEICTDASINTACFLELQKLIEEGVRVTKCSNCKRYFINRGSKNLKLCNRTIDSSNKTCKDVGNKNKYKKKIESNPILKAYNTAYNRNHSRRKQISSDGKTLLTDGEFAAWSKKARMYRDKCLALYSDKSLNEEAKTKVIEKFQRTMNYAPDEIRLWLNEKEKEDIDKEEEDNGKQTKNKRNCKRK